ncbi:MAG TPA: 3-deoxy-7-phosphoheptulonate synthase class II [Mycobacteriales bacterium]|jgi:3-deoxy-D-arabino-heptulosonate 7-phosphate (DAHP) synthase
MSIGDSFAARADRSTTGRSAWAPHSWRGLPCHQQPDWPDPASLRRVIDRIGTLPSLVTGAEIRRLSATLSAACEGEAFVLQAGDCAETFDGLTAGALHRTVRLVLQMAMLLAFGSGLPVVKIGRIAGQMAKPRSSPFEEVEGPNGMVRLPTYRGDMVNDARARTESRRPDPERMLRAYYHSAAVLNVLRSFERDGFAELAEVHEWNRRFVAENVHGTRSRKYLDLMNAMDGAVRFLRSRPGQERGPDFYVSHEALILPYEGALTRWDESRARWYATSAHLLWIGERTRQLDAAHVEFLSGVGNPIAVKLGPTTTPADVLGLCRRLNPDRKPGRLSLVVRMGAQHVREVLPRLIRAVRLADEPVLWMCDPMHGNTFVTESGVKTRRFTDIVAELRAFFDIHRTEGSHPGGVHVEVTAEDVTECLGGLTEVDPARLPTRYETACDPRLNATQSIDLAFVVAEVLHRRSRQGWEPDAEPTAVRLS